MIHPRLSGFRTADGRLIASENPGLLPRPGELVRAVAAAHGVGAVVCLTGSRPVYEVVGPALIHAPVRSVSHTQQIRAAVDEVDRCLASGLTVWVHCQRGLDRAPCVIACAMVRRGWSAGAAVEAVRHGLHERLSDRRLRSQWEATARAIHAAIGVVWPS